jgi:hypothetical protein
MALNELTREKKIEYFTASLSIAGIRFDNPDIIELVVDLYESVLEKGGKADLDSIMDLKNKWIERTQKPEKKMEVKKPSK